MSKTLEKSKPGDICQVCEGFWKERKQPSKYLVEGPNPTINKEIPIMFCTFCDGPAYELSLRNQFNV